MMLVATAINSGDSFLSNIPPRSKMTQVHPSTAGASLATKTTCTLSLSLAQPITEVEREKTLPKIIQGGMGVRISSWELARAVAKKGGLGVVSGTAMDVIFVRTLQDGEPFICHFSKLFTFHHLNFALTLVLQNR